MKNVNSLSTFASIALVAAGILMISCESEQKAWNRVAAEGSPEARLAYLEKYPGEKHAQEVRETQENYEFEQAVEKKSVQAFELFLRKHPKSKQAENVHSQIEHLRFEKAISGEDIKALDKFQRDYPNSKWEGEVRHRLERFRFGRATSSGNGSDLEYFLKLHPESDLANEARNILAVLREKENVVTLAEKGLLLVSAHGADIQKVKLKLSSQVDKELKVFVPVGTFFVCDKPSTQNMVAIGNAQITLPAKNDLDFAVTMEIAVACANRTRRVPGNSDSFQIQRHPPQQELEKLVRGIERVEASQTFGFAEKQAAVWIVTDDADFKELSILARSYVNSSSTKATGHREAAIGMKLCDNAGVLLGRRIEQDRSVLFGAISEQSFGMDEWALRRLGASGETVDEMALNILEHATDRAELEALLKRLEKSKPKDLPGALIRLLARDLPLIARDSIRERAAQLLRNLGTEESIPHLITYLETHDPGRSAYAAHALKDMSQQITGSQWEKSAVVALLAALKVRDDDSIRIGAALALGEMKVDEAVDPLIDQLLEGERNSLRAAAAQALGQIGDKNAIPALKQALSKTKLDFEKPPINEALQKLGKEVN